MLSIGGTSARLKPIERGMLSGASATISQEMSAAPQPIDPERLDRALDRLSEHCELVGRRTLVIEDRRVAVRAELERELGSELTRLLLSGLATASAA
jgi:hypothetical protein